MPELPEVETIRRGIAPLLIGRKVTRVFVRNADLRWPVTSELADRLVGQVIEQVDRRAKYLLLRCRAGTLLIHLGMSGKLSVVAATAPLVKHDHVDLVLSDGNCLRFNDSRRFGSILWTACDPNTHPLLARLGPEPLSREFSGVYLHSRAQGRKVSVKHFIMDSRVVVGIGNIYANEALFVAGIRPTREAGRVSLARYRTLASAIRKVLQAALEQGGTTLRDFRDGSGQRGYFQLHLKVYGRACEACDRCGQSVCCIRQGQRSTYYCKGCQH